SPSAPSDSSRPQDMNGAMIRPTPPTPAEPEPNSSPFASPEPGPSGGSVEVLPSGRIPPGEGSPDAFAPAAGGFSPFLNPVVGHAPLRADYRATWLPSEPVTGQATNLGYVEQDFSLSFSLWQCSTDEWLASASLRNTIFQTHAILPDTRQP